MSEDLRQGGGPGFERRGNLLRRAAGLGPLGQPKGSLRVLLTRCAETPPFRTRLNPLLALTHEKL